jgi:tetratricopeptide (TPR) repeat protein
MNRLEQLRQFIHDDPNDPFNYYALALEYAKSDVETAITQFEVLIQKYPDYLPTYYQAGNLFEATGNREQAVDVLKKGIALAKQQQQYKTLRELQSVLDELLYD